ncbi:MAG: phosphotransferase [Firmicutes bacterium]|nr:phosphotransferase [Bacillota bacterium]
MEPRLQAALNRWGCGHPQALSGDAGARQYFRVAHPTLGTALAVLYPPLGEGDDAFYDYQALQVYLDPVVRVPTLLKCAEDERCMLVEDLGDESLERRLTQHPEEEYAWAERVGDLLATWVGLLTEGAPSRAFFMLRAFDEAKFEFEWEYCRKHFFRDFLCKEPPGWLERLMTEIHGSLATRARFLAHRDFHVRNLMVQGDQLVLLDFQDARRGPATYDLASILFDGYWDWNRDAGRTLVEHVGIELGWDDRRLWEELNLTALQRNFKALGTFGFQLVHRQKTHFAPAIPRTLRHILDHFQRLNLGEGVLATEHWMRLAERRLLRSEQP